MILLVVWDAAAASPGVRQGLILQRKSNIFLYRQTPTQKRGNIMTETIEKQLSEHPIFKGLPYATISNIISCASEKSFAQSDSVFLEGEEANCFYIILSGVVDLSIHTNNRGPITIQSLHGGEVLGWSWLFPPFIWHFDATAREDTSTIKIDGKCIRRKSKKDPVLGHELMHRFSKVMLGRLNATRLQLVDMYGKSK